MLDEINEQTDQMQQIQDAMAQPIGAAADLDEDELMGELEVRHAPLCVCQTCTALLLCGRKPYACKRRVPAVQRSLVVEPGGRFSSRYSKYCAASQQCHQCPACLRTFKLRARPTCRLLVCETRILACEARGGRARC